MLIGGCDKKDILYDSTEIFDCVNAKFRKGPLLSKPKDQVTPLKVDNFVYVFFGKHKSRDEVFNKQMKYKYCCEVEWWEIPSDLST